MAHTLYELKPAFQAFLRPAVARMAEAGVSANQVTLAAMAISLGLGAIVAASAIAGILWPFLLLAPWLLGRMACNAIDGMLAREHGQRSALGAYLNELSDVVSDAALLVPFALVPPFGPWSVGAVIFVAALSEMAGALGPMVGAARRYDGPMGKSDRALVFGMFAIYVGWLGSPPAAAFWLMPAIAFFVVWNIVNRVRRGVAEARRRSP